MPAADLATTPSTRPQHARRRRVRPVPDRVAVRAGQPGAQPLAGLLLVAFVPAWYLLMAVLTGHQPLTSGCSRPATCWPWMAGT